MRLPAQTYLEFLQAVCIHIILYLILSIIQTWFLVGLLKHEYLKLSISQALLLIWSISVVFILSANALFFPLSRFSKLLSPLLPDLFCNFIFYFSALLLFGFTLNSIVFIKTLRFSVITMTLIILVFSLYPQHSKPRLQVLNQPNIIILGIDSLSPESVSPSSMPFFYHLLNQSIQFTNTISPLARTYPAWCTLLTGLYSKHHYAYENLVAINEVKSKASVIWEFDKARYKTLYATDDRRFSNLGKDFGFQQLIGPKTGINDFILGSFNDFPLGNLLINASIGSILFPYNYANRASFFSYYPNTFNAELKNKLAEQPQDKPLFLAVHFALPHWPYAFANSSPEELNNEFSLYKRDLLYQKALKQVDVQFFDFYSYLEKNNYLSNSLLILLSDHGEALYYPNSRLTNRHNYQGKGNSSLEVYFKNKTATYLNKSAGHGSDVLSPKQYHSVLAFQIYKDKHKVTSNELINTRIALIDLAPTLLAFINSHSKYKMDGISLLPTLLNPQTQLPERTFFLESGMYPNQNFSMKKAVTLGNQIYKVNPETGKVELKPEELNLINQDKLYAIIKGSWILALYPNDKEYIPVIQNLNTGFWIDNLNSPFARSTPAKELAQELQQFYGKQLAFPIH